MLDLQWKFSLAWSLGVKNALANFAALPQSFLLTGFSFWNISNARDETALSLALDPIHRPQRL